MKLKFENLGVIKSGEIDLSKELIILTGGNNTGKSYVSYLLYGVYGNMTKEIKKKLFNFISPYIEVVDDFPKIVSTIDLNTNFNKIIIKLSEFYEESFNEYFYRLFASKIIKPFVSLFFSEEKKDKILEILTSLNVTLDGFMKEYTVETINDVIICTSNFIEEHNKNNAVLLSKEYIVKQIFNIWVENLNFFSSENLIFSLRFFPAERSSINLFSHDIIQNKAKKLDEISLMSEKERKKVKFNLNYPLPILNYLYFINNLKKGKDSDSEYKYIADEIEILIGGVVSLNEFDEIIFKPKNSKLQLYLHITSSTVKSLAGIVFYFRYYAMKDDVIFIDEPELNLHPDNQIKLARILAKALNSGIKMVISTHSDYIIKEFNNLIMLNNDKDGKLIKKLKYDKDCVLDNNKVGAYYFPAGNNTVIEELEVSKTGISVESIDNAIDQQDYNSERIYYTLFEK